MATNSYDLGVIELFKGKAGRALLRFAVTEMKHGEYYTLKDFESQLDYSKRSIAQYLQGGRDDDHRSIPGPHLRFGVFEARNLDARIIHYTLADTDIVKMLQVPPGHTTTELLDLFDSTARQHLVEFFLDIADPDESYSMNGIRDNSDASYQGVTDHIQYLIDFGIVETVDAPRAKQYTLADSEINEYLYVLNDKLVRHYQNFDG